MRTDREYVYKKYCQYNTHQIAQQESINKKVVQYNTHRDTLSQKFNMIHRDK